MLIVVVKLVFFVFVDGIFYFGWFFGVDGIIVGEVVFNMGMIGY